MLTPIEQHGEYYFKRDDTFTIAGVRGGKVRTCWALAQGAKGLTTAGSRSSPQVNIVANIAQHLGIPCVAHTPMGELNQELQLAKMVGCEIFQHKAGYNSVIIARSRRYALETGFTDIPFGMECEMAVTETAKQVANIPPYVHRIIMPVGGGMSMAGVLTGLRNTGRHDIEVVGISVGANAMKRIYRWSPLFSNYWKVVDAGVGYSEYVNTPDWLPFTLDPIYEAKCIKFLQPGDLMWCVGLRQSYHINMSF